jgi:hypothetical protein
VLKGSVAHETIKQTQKEKRTKVNHAGISDLLRRTALKFDHFQAGAYRGANE